MAVKFITIVNTRDQSDESEAEKTIREITDGTSVRVFSTRERAERYVIKCANLVLETIVADETITDIEEALDTLNEDGLAVIIEKPEDE